MSNLTIGVAGGSGSGKSTFAKLLVEKLRPIKTVLISTDGFFRRPLPKMISPATGREYEDWNSPDSIDSEKVIDAVRQSRLEASEAQVVIVEGLSVLYFPELLELLDLKIFIDLDSDERMYRRIKRNMAMWGVPMEEVADYYLEAAKFGEEKHFLPTKRNADLVLNGGSDFIKPALVVESWVRGQIR